MNGARIVIAGVPVGISLASVLGSGSVFSSENELGK
jgi:hypothetical protein